MGQLVDFCTTATLDIQKLSPEYFPKQADERKRMEEIMVDKMNKPIILIRLNLDRYRIVADRIVPGVFG